MEGKFIIAFQVLPWDNNIFMGEEHTYFSEQVGI